MVNQRESEPSESMDAHVTGYACGFLFSDDRRHVVLIRKRRPAWQAGKLNGVGGND